MLGKLIQDEFFGDDSLMLVLEEHYCRHPEIFSKVLGLYYVLAKGEDLILVPEKHLGDAMLYRPNYQIKLQALLVEKLVGIGWRIDADEYREEKDRYSVVDVLIMLVSNTYPYQTRMVSHKDWNNLDGDWSFVRVVFYEIVPHNPKGILR